MYSITVLLITDEASNSQIPLSVLAVTSSSPATSTVPTAVTTSSSPNISTIVPSTSTEASRDMTQGKRKGNQLLH